MSLSNYRLSSYQCIYTSFKIIPIQSHCYFRINTKMIIVTTFLNKLFDSSLHGNFDEKLEPKSISVSKLLLCKPVKEEEEDVTIDATVRNTRVDIFTVILA